VTLAPGQLDTQPGKIELRAPRRMCAVSVNRQARSAILQGPRGRRFEVKVKDPTMLDRVKVGDRVEARYREAPAVAVEEALTR